MKDIDTQKRWFIIDTKDQIQKIAGSIQSKSHINTVLDKKKSNVSLSSKPPWRAV